MKYYPPVESRSNEELIGIANSTTDYWQKEFISLARKELDNRGVSKIYERKLLDKWEAETKEVEIKHKKWLDKNALEEYTSEEKIIIAIIAPVILLGKSSFGTSLSELKADNYIIKYRQRRRYLLLGVAGWIALIAVSSILN